MGSTITEKILARAAGRTKVSVGEYIDVRTDRPTTLAHQGAWWYGIPYITEWGVQVPFPEKIKLVDGHLGATASHNSGMWRHIMRDWANKVGLPEENIYDLGHNHGIENMVAVQNCWPIPGECYFQGCDGHISTAGALGAFAGATSFGTAAFLMRGWTWVKVPKSVKIVVKGTTGPGVMPRDVSEYVIGLLGPAGAGAGGVLEWTGPYIENLNMDGRFSICSQAIFTGAWTSIVNPDETTEAYVRSRTDDPFSPLVSDDDAEYADVIEVDVTDLNPQVVPPPQRHMVKDISELIGTPINRGFIGSDANAWHQDLAMAAKVLRGRKIKHDVILNVTPGTVEVLRQCLDDDTFRVLIDAECVVPTPNEGMEWGANTPLHAGDVCIASGQTNYPGRMGHRDAQIYLANPAVVAASCIAGEIVDPRPYL